MLDLMEEGVEAAEAGDDPDEAIGEDEETIGVLFGGAVVLADYGQEECGIEPEGATVDEPEIETGPDDGVEVESTGTSVSVGELLGIAEEDVVAIFEAALPGFDGGSSYSSGPDYSVEIVLDSAERDAMAICTEVSEALASHPDAGEGTVDLTIRAVQGDVDDPTTEEIELGTGMEGDVLASNRISAGDPGECR